MAEKLDIVGGLKNAFERGHSLDEAKQSFINAGYNPKDVEDSSRALSSGVLFLSASPRSQNPVTSPVSSYKPLESAKKEETQEDRKGLALAIILAVVLVLLVGVLLATVFAKDKILEILKSIGILK